MERNEKQINVNFMERNEKLKNLDLLGKSHNRIEIDLWVFDNLGFHKKNKEEGELYVGDSIYKFVLIY